MIEAEQSRLAALAELEILDTPPVEEFDELARLMASHFSMPIALVSFIGADRQWFKAHHGATLGEIPRAIAICDHTIAARGALVVEDLREDPRFEANPFVAGAPGLRFYAGHPISVDGVHAVGTICVLDSVPRPLDDAGRAALAGFAKVVEALVRAHLRAIALQRAGEAKLAQAAELAAKMRLLSHAERLAGVGAWSYDIAAKTLTLSDEVFALHDLPVGEPPKVETVLSHYPGAAAEVVRKALRDAIVFGRPFTFETDMVSAKGRERRVRATGEIDENASGRRVIGVFQDMTAMREAQADLQRAADIDALTGLANRTKLTRELETALAHAEQDGTRLALMLLDLDGFKEINDTRGHPAGDRILRTVAMRLSEGAGPGRCIARLGGDEFAILVPDPGPASRQKQFARQLLGRVRRPIGILGQEVRVSGTIGIAVYPTDAASPEQLLRCADIALYNGKRNERGSAGLYLPEIARLFDQRRVAMETVHRALTGNRLVPYYQPKICLLTGGIAGYEALARIRRQDGTMLAAGSFAPAFADAESARRIGERMVGSVTADLADLLARRFEPGLMSLNVAEADLSTADFPARLLKRLRDLDIPPERLELEITETMFLGTDSRAIRDALTYFSEAGVSIALDDFGTGFSSLTHLRDFPIDRIKIDRSFVAGLGLDGGNSQIVRALIGLAHSLGLSVVAEGIETEAQRDFLQAVGCDEGQGYLLGRPAPLDEVVAIYSSAIQPVRLVG